MSDLLETREVQSLLTKVSGLGTDTGDARVKRIVHRVVSDLFKTIEEFDVQPDEFWSAMSYLTELGQANEVGLLVPALALRRSSTFARTRRSARPASRVGRRVPSRVHSTSPEHRSRREKPGSTTAAKRARCCSWMVRSAT